MTTVNTTEHTADTPDDPWNQRALLDDLCQRINLIENEQVLTVTMGLVLKSLLRRAGDAPFLDAIRDAYVARSVDATMAERRVLSTEIIKVVIDMRPEVARAWQEAKRSAEAAEAGFAGPDRRHLDGDEPEAEQSTPPQAPTPQPPSAEVKPVAAKATPLTPEAEAEAEIAAAIAAHVQRVLAPFQAPPAPIPSAKYVHEQPFALFNPAFHAVVATFVTDELMPRCRSGLSKRIYREYPVGKSATAQQKTAYLTTALPAAMQIIAQCVRNLAHAQKGAEEHIAKAEIHGDTPPTVKWREITVPQSRPRAVKVFGVNVTMGQVTETRTIKIRADDGSRDLSADEMDALTALTHFRDLAANEGIDLPNLCDFGFLHLLLSYDVKAFTAVRDDLSGLGRHPTTSRDYLRDRIKKADTAMTNGMADFLLLCLFVDVDEDKFGLNDLSRYCVETSRELNDVNRKRPFLRWAAAQRPRELAFQFREALRTRVSVNDVEKSLRLMFSAWQILSSSALFKKELEGAAGVIAAFPIVFTGDQADPVFSEIATKVLETLAAASPDYERCVLWTTTAYTQFLKGSGTPGAKPGEGLKGSPVVI